MQDPINGILFDMDGVVHVGESAIDGADTVIRALDERHLPYRFLTNTTTRTPDALSRMLFGMGIPVPPEKILTTHAVAAAYLRAQGKPRCQLLVRDDVREMYDGIAQSDEEPDIVVVGDIGNRWNYDLLNRIFHGIMDGADIVALHKGRYWRTAGGLQLDIGAFVAGLEYATGKTATVVGKPSLTFFQTGISELGLDPSRIIMVGDDIENDIAGAQRAGVRGILVRTGKYRPDVAELSTVTPDATIDSIGDILNLIDGG